MYNVKLHTVMSKNAPLVNMIEEGIDNHKNRTFQWIIRIKNGGEI